MILCCGEALIDMLPATAGGEPVLRPVPGGAAFNSAIALGRLGVPVSFFSGLSSDPFGSLLRERLRESRVDLSPAVISGRPTTLAFVDLRDGQATYFFYDENTAGRMLSADDLPPPNDAVRALLSGGISLVAEPCGSVYETLMRREASHRVIMLDPNIRPAFIHDEERHRARIHRLFEIADIVKISDEDLDWIAPGEPQDRAIASILSAGASLVLLTSGARGTTAFWNGGSLSVPTIPVTVADTIGAGDTFNAGFLAALHERGELTKDRVRNLSEETLAAALSFASKAAAVTVSRHGANPPWRHELTP